MKKKELYEVSQLLYSSDPKKNKLAKQFHQQRIKARLVPIQYYAVGKNFKIKVSKQEALWLLEDPMITIEDQFGNDYTKQTLK